MKVRNIVSKTSGRKIANQFILDGVTPADFNMIGNVQVEGIRGYAFQSYQAVIAFIYRGQVFLDEKYWNYSVTTGKYRNQFLGETKAETEKKIKSGEYVLTDLNS